MATRYYSKDDQNFFDRINNELVGDLPSNQDGIINQTIVIYQHAIQETKTNMYGEAGESGKVYEAGVKLSCIIEATDFDWETTEFGPDSNQTATFSFQRDMLIDVSFRPDIGDVLSWNHGYFEINSTNENQLVAGDYNKNWTISCDAVLTRISTLNIERTRAF